MRSARRLAAARKRVRREWVYGVATGCLLAGASGCLATATALGVAAAQGPDEPEAEACDWGRDREIKGHMFLIPNFVESALVLSYLGTRTGLEFESIPDVPLDGLTVDSDQIRVAESIDAGVKLFDRVGLSLNLAGVASVGSEAEGFLARGSEYRLIGNLAAVVKIVRIEAAGTQVSARGFLGAETGDFISLLPVVDAVTDRSVAGAAGLVQGNLDEALLTPYSAFRWGGGVAAAQPITAVFSAQASVAVAVLDAELDIFRVSSDDRGSFEWTAVTPEFGLALTGDAQPLGIPFALLVEYQLALAHTDFDQTGEDISDTSHTLGAGVYYTGRSDLQAGLGLYTVVDSEPLIRRALGSPAADADEPSLTGVRLILRYFW